MLVTKLGMKGKVFEVCHCGLDGSYHHCQVVRREAVSDTADLFQLGGKRSDFNSQFTTHYVTWASYFISPDLMFHHPEGARLLHF